MLSRHIGVIQIASVAEIVRRAVHVFGFRMVFMGNNVVGAGSFAVFFFFCDVRLCAPFPLEIEPVVAWVRIPDPVISK